MWDIIHLALVNTFLLYQEEFFSHKCLLQMKCNININKYRGSPVADSIELLSLRANYIGKTFCNINIQSTWMIACYS